MSEDAETDAYAYAQKVFESQPFSLFIGAKLASISVDKTETTLELRPEHLQQHSYVHGGVLCYLADNAITFAGGMALKGDAVTSEFKINYLRPARGSSLIVRAKARSAGRLQAVCTCEVSMFKGKAEVLCAIAQGTVVGVGVRASGSQEGVSL